MELEEGGRVLPVAPNNKALGRQAETQPHVVLLGSMEPAIVVRRLPQSPLRYRCGACVILSGDAPDRLHACDYHSGSPSLYLIEPLFQAALAPYALHTAGSYAVLSEPSHAPSATSICCAAEGRVTTSSGSFLPCYSCNHVPPSV